MPAVAATIFRTNTSKMLSRGVPPSELVALIPGSHGYDDLVASVTLFEVSLGYGGFASYCAMAP